MVSPPISHPRPALANPSNNSRPEESLRGLPPARRLRRLSALWLCLVAAHGQAQILCLGVHLTRARLELLERGARLAGVTCLGGALRVLQEADLRLVVAEILGVLRLQVARRGDRG